MGVLEIFDGFFLSYWISLMEMFGGCRGDIR